MHMRVNNNSNCNKKTVIKRLLILRKNDNHNGNNEVIQFTYSNFNGYSPEYLSIKF